MYYTLADLVTGLFKGEIQDGDLFEAVYTGDKLIYKGGALAWLTIEGYVSTPLSITVENIEDIYKRVKLD